MSADIIAKPAVITKIGDDVDAMGQSIKLARHYLNHNVKLVDDNGVYLFLVGNMIKDKRTYIDGWYDEYIPHVIHTGADIRQIARDFTGTDEAQREAYDHLYRKRILDLGGNVAEVIHSPGEYREGDGSDVIQQPGFSNKQARGYFQKPHNAYDDALQSVYWDIQDLVDKLFEFKDDIRPIHVFGLDNPFEGWIDKWDGRWENVGTCADALRNLGDYWDRIYQECVATLGRFAGGWDGRAAGNCANWIDRFADQSIEHVIGLNDLADQILHRGLIIKDALEPVVEIAEDIANTVLSIMSLGEDFELPSLEDIGHALSHPGDALKSLFGKGEDVAKKIGGVVEHLGGLVKHASKLITAVVLTVDALWNLGDLVSDHDMGLTNFWTSYSLPEAKVR